MSDDATPGDTQPSSSTANRTLKLLSSSPTFGLRSLADASAIAANPAVVAEVFGATDVGRVRKSNQDQFLVAAVDFASALIAPTHTRARRHCGGVCASTRIHLAATTCAP